MTWAAADHARAFLSGIPGHPHDELADTVRILASPHCVDRLPIAVDATLRAMMIGYRHGSPAGAQATLAAVTVTASTPEEAAEAVSAFHAVALGVIDIDEGAITDSIAGVQICPGPDGRWFPSTLYQGGWRTGEWRPAPGVCDDPAEAYRAA
jgi:hypothetical protein